MSLEVTCVIPYGGPPRYLGEAVDSALTQGFERIVVVNDGRGPQELREIAGSPRVQVIDLDKKSGAAHARNRGVLAARTPFVAFLDADDVFCPGYLPAISAFVRERKLRCASAAMRYIGENAKRVGAPVSRDPGFALPSGFFAEVSLLRQAGNFPDSYSEDVLLFDAIRRITTLISCPSAGVLYRIHPGSGSSTRTFAMGAFGQLLPLYYKGDLTLEEANRIATEFSQFGSVPPGFQDYLREASNLAITRFLARSAYASWLNRDYVGMSGYLFRLLSRAPAALRLAGRKWGGPALREKANSQRR